MDIDELIQFAENNQLIRVLFYPAIIVRRFGWNLRESIQDDILDNLFDILDDDPVIKVNEFHGKFIVGCRSDIFRQTVKNKAYEPKLAQCCLNYLNPDRDVIDIGANIGFYTVLFGKELVGKKVLAIEPTPRALSLLYKNLLLNNIQDTTIVFEGVVSDQLGELDIHTITGKEEYSSLGAMEHPRISKGILTTLKVVSTTVDQLVKQHSLDPGFIKIDVEGMEHLVFAGMQDVLKEKRPVILSELSVPLLRKNGSSPEEVIKFIKQYDYDIVDPILDRMKPGRRKFGEILCLPRN